MRAFTLVEILVVIAIIAILSAILLPTFALTRDKARRVTCVSNLKQIGAAVEMYKANYDGYFPYAVDPSDQNPAKRSPPFAPAFEAKIPTLPRLPTVMRSYVARSMFHCASDSGFDVDELAGAPLDARPTCWDKFGSSYFYRTELAAYGLHESQLPDPSRLDIVFDAIGSWHGGGLFSTRRFNVLFADGHVKNIDRPQFDGAWAVPAR